MNSEPAAPSVRLAPSPSPAPKVLGHTEPRIWTPPLRELTPETSIGFDVIDFARDVVGVPLDPWEEWAAIHIGELLPNGQPRFRVVLLLVARQNGKTTLAMILILYWLFVESVEAVLGTSTDGKYAIKTWKKVCALAVENEWLSKQLAPKAVYSSSGRESLTTRDGSVYAPAANNDSAGRSMTVARWLCDELRQHRDNQCWESVEGAMSAVQDSQIICTTNQGDDTAYLLHEKREAALAFIETGVGDPRVGLFEWSSPPGADPTDIEALAMANPNMDRELPGMDGKIRGPFSERLVAQGAAAKKAGGDILTGFRQNYMCQRVVVEDPAIEPELWKAAKTDSPVDLAEHRDKLALCLDVAYGTADHASLVGAAVIDGKVHVEVIAAWNGFGCTKALRAELPDIVRRIRPRALGWFPAGPAATVAADLAAKRGQWPPRRVITEEIRGDVIACCMGLVEQVHTGDLVQPGDPMLDKHVENAQRLNRGDGFVFVRRGAGPVDGVYAMAGAVHLARTLPPPPPPLEMA